MTYNLNELDIEIIERKSFSTGIVFIYNGTKYYYKRANSLDNLYNELIAEKIAKKIGIPCCEYNLAEYFDNLGVISKMIDNNKYHSMGELLNNYYNNQIGKNNIKSINKMLINSFSKEIADRLKEELLRIFLFDALIGNCDRNSDNYGLILDDNPRFAPLFDNENMLSDYAIYQGNYTLEIDDEDYNNVHENLLYKLLNQNDYAKYLLKELLPVISVESLEEIFNELERENDINSYIKNIVLKKITINRSMIEKYYQSKVKRKIIRYNNSSIS